MAEYRANSMDWDADSTSDPSVAIIEEVPTLTVATILGVTIVILIAIVVVFVLGVLIDCRQQRLLDKKISKVRRLKNGQENENLATDEISIANNMQASGTSAPPSQVLRHIP